MNGSDTKPYIQKAYEKFAMAVLALTNPVMEKYLQQEPNASEIDASIVLMKAYDDLSMSSGGLYIVLKTDEESLIPIAKLLSKDEVNSAVPEYESCEEVTKLFWSAFKDEKRETMGDFDKPYHMPSFSEYYD